MGEMSAPSVKQKLPAIRHLFDWLVMGHVVDVNPSASVRGPSHVMRQGKTLVLDPAEARGVIDSIDVTAPVGLRDQTLIALMVYSFARIGAALGIEAEDADTQNRRLWARLREKGGKAHAMPCHHSLEAYLIAYVEVAGLDKDPEGPLFRTIGRTTGRPLTRTPTSPDYTGKEVWRFLCTPTCQYSMTSLTDKSSTSTARMKSPFDGIASGTGWFQLGVA